MTRESIDKVKLHPESMVQEFLGNLSA